MEIKLNDNAAFIAFILIVATAGTIAYRANQETARLEFNRAAETIQKLETSKTARIELDGKYYEVKALPEPSAP